MLAEMKYLNISTELAQISIHQEQPRSLKNTFRPAELHRHYDPPLADVAATQVEIDIDTYNSRKTYGFLNHDDFAKKYAGTKVEWLAREMALLHAEDCEKRSLEKMREELKK